jgi:hypothetical protein
MSNAVLLLQRDVTGCRLAGGAGARQRLIFAAGRWFGVSWNVLNSRKKSRARPASPRSRPTSPVNGAGGITGCFDDSEAPKSFQPVQNFFVHG